MGRAAARAASKLVREVVEDITKGVRKVDAPSLPRTPKRPRGRPRADAPDPKPAQPDPSRADRGDGRDPSGRFTGKGGYGKDKEKIGLDQVSERLGKPVIRKQVRVSVEGSGHHRYYDGLVRNPDGTYTGVEIKSGGAVRNQQQREFDEQILRTGKGKALLDGKEIVITHVIERRVP